MARGPQFTEAFRQGLSDLGYVEGRNLVIEIRSAEGKAERLPALAAELVALKVDVILARVHNMFWLPSKRPAPSPLYSPMLAIRSPSGSSTVSRALAAISPG